MDELAQLLIELGKTCQVRLSNKGGSGYWWCYLNDREIIEQGTDPLDCVRKAQKVLEARQI